MRRTFYALIVAGLVLSACTGADTSDTTTTTAAETTTTTQAATTTTAPPADSTTTTESAGSGGGDECLIGTWTLDDDAFFETVFEAFAEETAGVGEVTAGDGVFTTTFEADGTVSAIRQDWGFTVETEEGTFRVAISGDQSGTWETDGTNLLLNLNEGSGFDVRATVLVDGEELVLPSAPIDVPAEALASSSEYTCDGDVLEVTNEGVTSRFDRS